MKPLHVIEGPYQRDVLDQPRALRETHRRLAVAPELAQIVGRLSTGAVSRIVLTGMGSSYHGLLPLQLRLLGSGLTSATVETSELLYYQEPLLSERALLVLASQSGRSAEIVRLLDAVRERDVTVIGVTNTADSPLAARAAACLLTHAGEEATVSCKTYLASQMALAFLGEALVGGDAAAALAALEPAIAATESYVSAWRAHVDALAPHLDGVRAVYYAGRGPSLAAAGSAGLITKESTHLPAEGMSSAAFRHGPMEMLDPAVFLLVFGGPDRTRALNASLVKHVRAAGARAFLVSADAPEPVFRLPELGDLARPVLELLPVEMITLTLAALRGREAGRFERATKVTATE